MDKQLAFETLIQTSIKNIMNGAGISCTFYLMNYVLYELRPDWLQNNRLESGFEQLMEKMDRYLKKSDRATTCIQDAVFSELNLGYHGKENGTLKECVWRSVVNPAHLGLCISERQEDQQFMRNTLSWYTKRVFPDSPKSLSLFLKKRAQEMISLMPMNLSSNALNPHTVFDMPQSASFERAGFSEIGRNADIYNEIQQIDNELRRYAIMMLGNSIYFSKTDEKDQWKYIEGKNGEVVVDPDSLFAREAACLQPRVEACLGCQPEFQDLLATIYYVRANGFDMAPMTKRTDPQKDRYFEAARNTILPFIQTAYSSSLQDHSCHSLVSHIAIDVLAGKKAYEDTISDLREELEEERQKTCRLDSYAKELATQRDEVAAAKKKADSATIELNRIKEEVSRLEAQNKQLSMCLSESKSAYDAVNRQLIELLENEDVLLDDDEISELTTPEAQSGIRTRIGEDAYQKLAAKKLVVVGGHTNTQNALRELFPNWKFYSTNELLPDTMSSVDAIAVLSRYASHKSFQKAKSVAKSNGIPLVMAHYNGPSSICQALAKQIISYAG